MESINYQNNSNQKKQKNGVKIQTELQKESDLKVIKEQEDENLHASQKENLPNQKNCKEINQKADNDKVPRCLTIYSSVQKQNEDVNLNSFSQFIDQNGQTLKQIIRKRIQLQNSNKLNIQNQCKTQFDSSFSEFIEKFVSRQIQESPFNRDEQIENIIDFNDNYEALKILQWIAILVCVICIGVVISQEFFLSRLRSQAFQFKYFN